MYTYMSYRYICTTTKITVYMYVHESYSSFLSSTFHHHNYQLLIDNCASCRNHTRVLYSETDIIRSALAISMVVMYVH